MKKIIIEIRLSEDVSSFGFSGCLKMEISPFLYFLHSTRLRLPVISIPVPESCRRSAEANVRATISLKREKANTFLELNKRQLNLAEATDAAPLNNAASIKSLYSKMGNIKFAILIEVW